MKSNHTRKRSNSDDDNADYDGDIDDFMDRESDSEESDIDDAMIEQKRNLTTQRIAAIAHQEFRGSLVSISLKKILIQNQNTGQMPGVSRTNTDAPVVHSNSALRRSNTILSSRALI